MIAEPDDLGALLEDDELIERALAEAVRQALLDHKRTGDPVAEWRDGRVVWIPADEIVVEPAPRAPRGL